MLKVVVKHQAITIGCWQWIFGFCRILHTALRLLLLWFLLYEYEKSIGGKYMQSSVPLCSLDGMYLSCTMREVYSSHDNHLTTMCWCHVCTVVREVYSSHDNHITTMCWCHVCTVAAVRLSVHYGIATVDICLHYEFCIQIFILATEGRILEVGNQ